MNKHDLARVVAESFGGNVGLGEVAVDAVLETIAAALADGKKVSIAGFGSFEVRRREARMGRNPRTGEPIQIKASHAPAFRAGKALKAAVNVSAELPGPPVQPPPRPTPTAQPPTAQPPTAQPPTPPDDEL